jgi:hypothetical protein
MAAFKLPITGFCFTPRSPAAVARVVINWAPTAYGISKRPPICPQCSMISLSRLSPDSPPKDQDRLRTVQVLGQQQLRCVRCQPDHRHRRSKPLNREHELYASARV